MKLLERLRQHAAHRPQAAALLHAGGALTYAELQSSLLALIEQLQTLQADTLALDMDNGPAWALMDLAALACGITLVPLPPFFSPQQMQHTLAQAGVQMVISDQPQRLRQRLTELKLEESQALSVCGQRLSGFSTGLPRQTLPRGIAKITFTSGTTAEPKGVMLTTGQLERVVSGLVDAVEVKPQDRHLALTPLAVLLENVAGLYVPLWAGASVALPSLAETGLIGAAGLDAPRMLKALSEYAATSAIFSPQMLQGVVTALQAGQPQPEKLRFIALGGAAVSRRLLEQAEDLGLPVYEGYGLSEFASVVCLNRPGERRLGSVGKPLPHADIRISADGEVLIAGNLFAGYLGETSQVRPSDWWHSGDIGYLDDEGFLHLQGRRRHIFITAYGRNVSPEWVERELVLEPDIVQAAVFGEARPWNAAVIYPAAGSDESRVDAAIRRVNQLLPDYARISQWITAEAPFTVGNSQLSGTGRLRREAIHQHYQMRLDALYTEEFVV